MTEPDSLVLEILRQMRASMDEHTKQLQAMNRRLASMELSIAGIRRTASVDAMSIAEAAVRADEIDERLRMVERRLELRDR